MKRDLMTRVMEEFDLKLRPEHMILKIFKGKELTLADVIKFAVRQAATDCMTARDEARKQLDELD
jgi:hypothetical protein